MRTIASTCANEIGWSSLIKVSTFWMCSSVGHVDGRTVRLSFFTHVLSTLKSYTHLYAILWFMGRAPYRTNIQRWISTGLTSSAHRKRTTTRCSFMLQSLSRTRLNSLLPGHLTEQWNAAHILLIVIPCALVISCVSVSQLFLSHNLNIDFTVWFTFA